MEKETGTKVTGFTSSFISGVLMTERISAELNGFYRLPIDS